MPASAAVREAISNNGPLRFDAYVDLCLYSSDGGFFASGSRAGRDFLTSVEVGPLFAELIAEALCRWMDEPQVYEVGSGTGVLATGVIRELKARGIAFEYAVVERSEALLAQSPAIAQKLSELPTGMLSGVVFCNELLDNLPFRALRVVPDAVAEELFIVEDGRGGFDESWLPLSAEDRVLAQNQIPGLEQFAALKPFPWASAAIDFVEEVASRCDRFVLIDYGASTGELVQRGIEGWMRTFRSNERGDSPLMAPGSQDITIDVPFDQLLRPSRQISQADFLNDLGIGEMVEEGKRIWREAATAPTLDAMKARSRISEAEALLEPSGMGAFQVLIYT